MKMTSNYLTTILNSETFLYLPRNNTKNYLKSVAFIQTASVEAFQKCDLDKANKCKELYTRLF